MSRATAIAVFGFSVLFFFFFFLWPIGETVRGAFATPGQGFTLDYIFEVFRNPVYVEGLVNALILAIASTALTLMIALPLALVSDRFLFPGRTLLSALVLVPMILPPFVGAIGVRQILGQQGALNALLESLGLVNEAVPVDWLGQGRFWGVVIMNALHLYPVLFLNITAALSNVDPAMEEAAENLGCTGVRKFRRITLPLIMPGVFAGGAIVFIWAFTELGVPLMFEYTRVTPVQIFYGIRDISGNPFPYALVVVMLASTVLLYAASRYVLGNSAHGMMPKATSQGGPRPVRRVAAWGCTALFGGVTALALLPHIGVILTAFSSNWYGTILPASWTLEHFEGALGHSLTLLSIQNSLKYASLATILDVVLGIGIAYVVTRTKLPGRGFLDAMAMLPLAVPGLVLAFGYLAMTQPGKTFEFLNPLVDPLAIIVIAYAVRRLPYVVRSVAAGLQQTSVTLEEAAQNLGASPLRALRRVTLPLILANVLAGGLLAFSFAMLEVSDSLILAQRMKDYPITKAIFELYQLLGEGPYLACALGVWAMLFLAATVFAANLLLGKKLGGMFRL
ncbi:iron(III) transport system permease protein [Terrimicrobium sacchariphilum]|uniref:Iron(III) transport system permease protein n=1 Tax=Terrimicrobium sacchariphilum TaxID=690879 RepID=A0A146G891_TERSA|nr:iron ABC transporter permease [Terrimicrobium sacchariphilum]GAT33681.1 iron(III) transport system permease protein [Terrimicrobium sacchariphilum]